MAAIIGKGFREIWRPLLPIRPLSVDDLTSRRPPKWSAASSSRFGDDPTKSLDLTSLHFAVAPARCNMHIDQTGSSSGWMSESPVAHGSNGEGMKHLCAQRAHEFLFNVAPHASSLRDVVYRLSSN